MARLRIIKPGFFLDEHLADCSPLARLLFAGLWTIADREGRLEDRPRRIKTQVLPYDGCDIEALLSELAEHGFIIRYGAEGRRYISVPSFSKHQKPHTREAQSTIPDPIEFAQETAQTDPRLCVGIALAVPSHDPGDDEQRGNLELGTGNLEQGETRMSGAEPPDDPTKPPSDRATDAFRGFWSAYPRKERKAAALSRWLHLTRADREAALLAAGHYGHYASLCPDDPLMLPATFLSKASRAWEDWVAGIPEARLRGNRARASPTGRGITSEEMRAAARALRERRGANE